MMPGVYILISRKAKEPLFIAIVSSKIIGTPLSDYVDRMGPKIEGRELGRHHDEV